MKRPCMRGRAVAFGRICMWMPEASSRGLNKAGAWDELSPKPGFDARRGGCARKHDKRRQKATFERGGAGVLVALCHANVRFCRGNVVFCHGFTAFCRGVPGPDPGKGEVCGRGHCPPGLVVEWTALVKGRQPSWINVKERAPEVSMGECHRRVRPHPRPLSRGERGDEPVCFCDAGNPAPLLRGEGRIERSWVRRSVGLPAAVLKSPYKPHGCNQIPTGAFAVAGRLNHPAHNAGAVRFQ